MKLLLTSQIPSYYFLYHQYLKINFDKIEGYVYHYDYVKTKK